MDTWLIVLITFVVAFWFGALFGKTHHRRRDRFLLRSLVILFALVFSLFALAGLVAFISPTLAMSIASKLPPDIQNVLFMDLLLRGGTGLWVFLVLSGILWWVQTRI